MKAFAVDARLLANVHFEGDGDEALRFLKVRPEGSRIKRKDNVGLVLSGSNEIIGYIYKGKYRTMSEWSLERATNITNKIKERDSYEF